MSHSTSHPTLHRRIAIARPAMRRSAGLSLVELMVGLVIALIISLVIFNVFIVAEGQRRTTAAGSDAQQSGSLSSFTLARYLRMGGAGLERVPNLWGCNLLVTQSTGTNPGVRVPLPSTIEAPFSGLGLTNLRATPILIVNASDASNDSADNATPDALMIFAGVHRSVNTWLQTTSPATTDKATVLNSVGLQANDLLLAVEQDPGDPRLNGDCQMVQSTSAIETNATLKNYLQSEDNEGRSITLTGGAYTPSEGLAPGALPYSGDALLANLGDAPLMRLFALGPTPADPSELRMYNMLDGNVQSIGDGMVNLQAVYGINTTIPATNEVTQWVAPTGAWKAATLMDGSAASRLNIEAIRAVRLNVITRSALVEKDDVSADSWTAFDDDANLAVAGTRTDEQRKFRYRQFEQIIPVRNTLLVVENIE